MAQHTIDLPCAADTYIDQQNPSISYGSSTTLKGGRNNVSGNIYESVIFMKFNFDSLPAHKKVTNVKLRFYNVNALTVGGSDVSQLITSIVTRSWADSDTWNSINPLIRGIGGTLYLKNQSIPGAQYIEVDITSVAMASMEDLKNNGVKMAWTKNSFDTAHITIQSREAATPPMLRITYEDIPPNSPTPTEPIGLYKDSKSVIRFSWQYNSDVGGVQKKFDLQWSSDQTNWNTVSQTTSNTYYDMPADTLPAGNIYWRVRCYNEYDDVGAYSDIQSFYSIAAPSIPVINAVPTDAARPVVSWSVSGQQAYQLQVLKNDSVFYDSGVVFGINIRQHKVKAWLDDSEYTVQLRIKNEYDLWSEWGTANVTISTSKPASTSLTLQKTQYGIEVMFANPTGRALIYRDGICIAETSETEYIDYAVVNGKQHTYAVRTISEDPETFNDSYPVSIIAEFKNALIAPASDLSDIIVFDRALNAPPKRTYSRQSGGGYLEYSGRKHPVWEPTEHISEGLTVSFFMKTWAKVEAFISLYDKKEVVLYRDTRGKKIFGILNNLSTTDERGGYTVSFTISGVDYNEEVEV